MLVGTHEANCRGRTERAMADGLCAAATVGIRRAYLYRLLSAYRQRPQTSTLIPHHRGRRRNTRLLDPKIEFIVQAAMKDLYLRENVRDFPT